MELIDRDALKYDPLPKADRNYRTYNIDDAYDDGYSDAMVDVSNAPVINAIPIEWIEQYGRENWYDFGTQYNAITEMLKAWREKNDKID